MNRKLFHSQSLINARVVILSEAKDLRRERRPDVSIHGAATPISIFQFPFSTLPGGTAKP